ncbi:MAG: LemA family protein [Nanoarchaeota archaeon]
MEEEKKMSGSLKFLAGLGVVVVLALLYVGGTFNGLVRLDENADQKWNNVQTAYERRLDLIPNLVSTVKASAEFERSLQTKVAELRSGILNSETPAELNVVGRSIDSALTFAFEAYPNIKTTDQFLQLNSQLEGTENRIKVERDNFNVAVRDYNVKVRKVPSNIIAGMFDFETKEGFTAEAGAEKTPDVGDLFEQ